MGMWAEIRLVKLFIVQYLRYFLHATFFLEGYYFPLCQTPIAARKNMARGFSFLSSL